MLLKELIRTLRKLEEVVSEDHKVVFREHCIKVFNDKDRFGVKSIEIYTYDDGCVIEVNKVYKDDNLEDLC